MSFLWRSKRDYVCLRIAKWKQMKPEAVQGPNVGPQQTDQFEMMDSCISIEDSSDDLSVQPADQMATVMEMMFKPESLLKIATMKMPFGKYQGRVLVDLPEVYVAWFIKKGLPSGELGELLALLYEVKVNGLESLFTPLRQAPIRF